MTRSRFLLLGCSQAKRQDEGVLPAIERYDGPAFRVLRRFFAGRGEQSNLEAVFILSAEYGLIHADTPIAAYDRLMSNSRAKALHGQILDELCKYIAGDDVELFVSMGKTYLHAIAGLEDRLPTGTRVLYARGAPGKKLEYLWAWLREQESPALTEYIQASLLQALPKTTPQKVMLRGRQVCMTTEQALTHLRQAKQREPDAAHHVTQWFIEIDGERISPKWAASRLFGVSVAEFAADEARRVLAGLGLPSRRLIMSSSSSP